VAVGDLVPSLAVKGLTSGPGSAVLELLRGADISFGDLEISLSERGFAADKLMAFQAEPRIAADLRDLGFNALSLANNHSFDYGPDALVDTLAVLEQNGIGTAGAGVSLERAERPLLVQMPNCRFGLLAWSCLLPLGSAAGPARPGVAPIRVRTSYEVDPARLMEQPGKPPDIRTALDEDDLRRVVHRVGVVRDEVDFLAIAIHWGVEGEANLAEYQRPLGHALIDAGADLVLGSHVHAIHGIERYKGRAILYSQGNFVAQQPRALLSERAIAMLNQMSPDAYMARVTIGRDRGYELEIIPVATDAAGLPSLAPGEHRRAILDRVARLSSELGTELEQRDGGLFFRTAGDRVDAVEVNLVT
jgi:poly-gamma-glutamate synthesis protein (capsule biosynthesis protein)